MEQSLSYPKSKRQELKEEAHENKVSKKKRIASQVAILTEFIYQEMKKVKDGEITIYHIRQSFFDKIDKMNLFLGNTDVPKLQKAINKTIDEYIDGKFDNGMIGRGLLNGKHAGFLEALENRLDAIATQSLLSGYFYLEVNSSTFMESDYSQILLASKDKDLLESMARKIELIEHNTTASVYPVRGTSRLMLHKSHSDWNYSHVEENFLGFSEPFLQRKLKEAEKEYGDNESSNIYITEVKFVEQLTKDEQNEILKEINPYINNPNDYLIGIKRKEKAIKNGKYFIKNAAKSYDFYKDMQICLKNEQTNVFY